MLGKCSSPRWTGTLISCLVSIESILKYDFNCAGNEVSLDADKENV